MLSPTVTTTIVVTWHLWLKENIQLAEYCLLHSINVCFVANV